MNTTLTAEEWSTAHETMLNGASAASRLASYIGSMKITDETNSLYRDALAVGSECWDARDYIYSLGFVGS